MPTKAETTAKQLIEQSKSRDSIAHHEYSLSLERVLRKRAKGMSWVDGEAQFWGGTDKSPWRVHLDVK